MERQQISGYWNYVQGAQPGSGSVAANQPETPAAS